MRIALVVIATIVTVGAVGGLGVIALELAASRFVTETHALPGDVRSLAIDTGDVPVPLHIVTDVGAEVPRVDLRLITKTRGPLFAIDTDGDGIRITLADSDSGFLRFNGTGAMKVVLPPDIARDLSLTIDRPAGALTVDSDLDRLAARTGDGTLTLGGSARLMEVAVENGDIRTDTKIAVAESFRGTSKVGSIRLEFSAAPRYTEVVAGGDVSVEVPSSQSYRIRAEPAPGIGHSTVSVPETTNPRAAMVTARSVGGNVRVAETS
ncbi:hypothetical protein [Mycolicibacterium celeriflavum]|uniref:hypothetical protein n=1 Tax=Mycolicibacterium celeriflavum TaxID=1249101 RepID=UPI003CF8EA57